MARKPAYPDAKSYTDRHGRRRWRFRPKGGRGFSRELGGDYGSQDFARRYAEAQAEFDGAERRGTGAARVTAGSLADLVARFKASPAWLDLTDSTRRAYRAALDWLQADYGQLPVKGLRRRHVADLLATKAGTPGAANNARKRLAQLLDHAVSLEWITENPARHVKSYRLPPGGFHSWTEAEIAQFLAIYPPGTAAHLALQLMLNTGAARVDAVQLGPWNLRAGRIEYRRQKTARSGGQLVSIPLHPDLAAALAGLPEDRSFLATRSGAPRTPAGLGNAMRKWCDTAGLPACTSHGLRKACARRLAEAGATASEIQSITGHRTLAEVQRYTEAASRETMADAAHGKLMARESAESLVNHAERFTTRTGQGIENKVKGVKDGEP